MARATGSSLKDLLEESFGPYLEEEALTTACKGTTENHPVALNEFLLECGGVATGLNECEHCQPDYDKNRFSSIPVRFHGILEIQNLSWLTEFAMSSIEEELRERDVLARSTPGIRASASNLSLKRIYSPAPGFSGPQLKVKMKIQGTKHLPAVYLRAKHVPDGLMIQSQAQGRRYAVEGMHIYTFRMSKLYLGRYRLMRVLEDLLKLEGERNHHYDISTPLSQRTPLWFVDLYMKYMAYAGGARRWRPVFDADTDPNVGRDGQMKPGREHVLRHVPRAEIAALFAEHSGWIADQVGNMTVNKWLDVGSWKAWAGEVRRMQRLVAQEGVSPGDEDSFEDHSDDVASDAQSRSAQKGKKPKQRRAPPRNASSRTSAATSSTLRSADPPSHGPSRRLTPEPYIDDTTLRTYDPDFSPVSTPPGSPSSASSDGLPSRPTSPVDPEIAALIPSAFTRPPQPTATLKWVCEVEGCGYLIDLLRLTDANFDLAGDRITEDERRRLKAKRWTVQDTWARDAFGYMVSGHREQHLTELGIKLVMEGREPKLRWIHPDGTHRPSNQLRKVKKDNRRPAIKLEDR